LPLLAAPFDGGCCERLDERHKYEIQFKTSAEGASKAKGSGPTETITLTGLSLGTRSPKAAISEIVGEGLAFSGWGFLDCVFDFGRISGKRLSYVGQTKRVVPSHSLRPSTRAWDYSLRVCSHSISAIPLNGLMTTSRLHLAGPTSTKTLDLDYASFFCNKCPCSFSFPTVSVPVISFIHPSFSFDLHPSPFCF